MIEELVQHIPNTLGGNLSLAIVIGLAFYFLCKGADRLVDSAVDVARDLHIPKLIIGGTIVSLGTTSPETAVSVMAALKGNPALALGNGVGSVICDQCLILGIAMSISILPMDKRILYRQSLIVLAAALLLCAFAWLSPSKTITRPMGFILVAGLAVYLYVSYLWAKQSRQMDLSQVETAEPPRPLWQAFLWMILGLAVLVVASQVLVPSVTLAALRLGIPDAVIAATLVAFGTSLPEFMTMIASVRKGHPEIVLGNVLGADGLNVLWVIGLSAAAAPLEVDPIFYRLQAPTMIFVLLLFQFYLITTRDHFRRWQGMLLVACYVFFVGAQYLL